MTMRSNLSMSWHSLNLRCTTILKLGRFGMEMITMIGCGEWIAGPHSRAYAVVKGSYRGRRIGDAT